MKRIDVLLSGRGSNMSAIARTMRSERWPATIAGVIADRPGAAGLQLAAGLGLPTAVVDHRGFARREDFEQALREAIDALRPAGQVSAIDRSWWPYLICTGEYETGEERGTLQSALALSASTYSRAKRQGLDRIAGVLPQIVDRMLESPVALASQQIPRIPDFVGRRDEQSYYAWRLQAESFAHIWGLPGSGKTALAAELAAEGHRYGQTILWHTCRPGRDSTLLGIVRGLAQALAAAGDETLWRQLRQSAHEAQDAAALLDTLRERLLARPAVVVLDDVHHADAVETAALLDALADLVECHLGAATLRALMRA